MAKNATHPNDPIHQQTRAARRTKGSTWRVFVICGSAILLSPTHVHGQDCNSNGVTDACDIAEPGACFDNPALWAIFDAGANGVGSDPDGFAGAVFDGRYVYFVPYNNGTGQDGEVLRYDTAAGFATASSWTTYDPGAGGVGSAPDGFEGAVFDGRYIYFVPFLNGTNYHGEVLRYDTTGSFSIASSWTTFDPGANGVGDDPDGFRGAVFDGRYVYFVPYYNGTLYHGEVLRYDTVPGSEDCNANATPDECEPPLLSLVWAHSVAAHKVGGGQTQEFYIDLDITGDPLRRTSEPRNSGVRTLECQFSQDVAAAEVRISGPTGLCAVGCPMNIAPGVYGPASLGRVDLPAPLPNAELYTLTITASTMTGCDLVHDLCVAALAGDFNSDGAVTSGDKGALLGFVFQPIVQPNARYDLQVNGGDSGAIDVGDVGAWVGFFGNTVAGRDCP